jgi:hypothetical protein
MINKNEIMIKLGEKLIQEIHIIILFKISSMFQKH